MSDEQKERQKQVLFLQRLQETTKRARQNGNTVTQEELSEAFSDLDLDEAQMLQVREYLHSSGIGIGEALPAEEVLTDEEIDHLKEYEEMIDAIGVPSENILDAVKLSAMAASMSWRTRPRIVPLPLCSAFHSA